MKTASKRERELNQRATPREKDWNNAAGGNIYGGTRERTRKLSTETTKWTNKGRVATADTVAQGSHSFHATTIDTLPILRNRLNTLAQLEAATSIDPDGESHVGPLISPAMIDVLGDSLALIQNDPRLPIPARPYRPTSVTEVANWFAKPEFAGPAALDLTDEQQFAVCTFIDGMARATLVPLRFEYPGVFDDPKAYASLGVNPDLSLQKGLTLD